MVIILAVKTKALLAGVLRRPAEAKTKPRPGSNYLKKPCQNCLIPKHKCSG